MPINRESYNTLWLSYQITSGFCAFGMKKKLNHKIILCKNIGKYPIKITTNMLKNEVKFEPINKSQQKFDENCKTINCSGLTIINIPNLCYDGELLYDYSLDKLKYNKTLNFKCVNKECVDENIKTYYILKTLYNPKYPEESILYNRTYDYVASIIIGLYVGLGIYCFFFIVLLRDYRKIVKKRTQMVETEQSVTPVVGVCMNIYSNYSNNDETEENDNDTGEKCGICMQKMHDDELLSECKECKNKTHMKCLSDYYEKNRNKDCIYCRNNSGGIAK